MKSRSAAINSSGVGAMRSIQRSGAYSRRRSSERSVISLRHVVARDA